MDGLRSNEPRARKRGVMTHETVTARTAVVQAVVETDRGTRTPTGPLVIGRRVNPTVANGRARR